MDLRWEVGRSVLPEERERSQGSKRKFCLWLNSFLWYEWFQQEGDVSIDLQYVMVIIKIIEDTESLGEPGEKGERRTHDQECEYPNTVLEVLYTQLVE